MRKVILNKDILTIIKENLDGNIYNEVDSSEVDIKPFKPQQELNPKIWINGKLNSKVRLRLLDIADDFIEFLNVNWVKPIDIVFTGSLANYNWTRYSDIDIHIIMDYSKVYKKKEFVEEYFEMKKYAWSDEHDNLKIYGFPIELYVEDINNDTTSSGVFSLEKNVWIVEPHRFSDGELDKSYIKTTSAKIMTKIDDLYEKYESTNDEYQIDKISNNVKRLFDMIKNIRHNALKNEGEMSNGNIIYKVLRNTKYLDKLFDLKSLTYDKLNSIK